MSVNIFWGRRMASLLSAKARAAAAATGIAGCLHMHTARHPDSFALPLEPRMSLLQHKYQRRRPCRSWGTSSVSVVESRISGVSLNRRIQVFNLLSDTECREIELSNTAWTSRRQDWLVRPQAGASQRRECTTLRTQRVTGPPRERDCGGIYHLACAIGSPICIITA
jgi:hypothetical protein